MRAYRRRWQDLVDQARAVYARSCRLLKAAREAGKHA